MHRRKSTTPLFLLRLPRLTNLVKGGYICMVLNFSRLKPKSLKIQQQEQ